MIRQCAWCKVLMGQVAPLDVKDVTHGICKKCDKGLMEQVARMEKKAK